MKNKLPYIVATSILLGIAVLAVYTQTQNASKRNQLSFTLKPLRESVLPLETIGLEFAIANQTDESLKLHGVESLGWIKLEIRKPSGETFVPKQLSHLIRRKVASEKIFGPGQKKAWIEKLEFKLNDFFGEVGEYQIRASSQNREDLLTTDWVTLVVEQPQGEDLRAYEKLKTLPAMRDGILIPGFDTKAHQVSFIEDFPTSRYADYYRFDVGSSLVNKNPSKALEYLDSVASKADFVFADDAKVKANQVRGEIERARRVEENRKVKAKRAGN